jgi:hypothetical protein
MSKELNCEVFETTVFDTKNKLEEVSTYLTGAKLLNIETVTNGFEDKEIRGVNIYFMLQDGTQREVEIYPSDSEPDKLYVGLN